MSKIVSIGTALPAHRHEQQDILRFMERIYAINAVEKRKLQFLYGQSRIESRYSVISDYSRPIGEWKFYPRSENVEPFPSLEARMQVYHRHAASLSVDAIRNCAANRISGKEITHLITVSCTGMSAPGLDLQIMELMDLPRNIFRTSINFMGCYAAIHALKMADMICRSYEKARVMVVCTELCTLHFQKEPSQDNISSSLLFGDGSAAALVVPDNYGASGLRLEHFYGEVLLKGKKDMAWDLSSTGFQMTLSSYIPDLIGEDFSQLLERALPEFPSPYSGIGHWCIHPGGRKILEVVQKSLGLENGALKESYAVLQEHGNMSSPTILFVLQRIMQKLARGYESMIFGAAFGPGLTMETFLARQES